VNIEQVAADLLKAAQQINSNATDVQIQYSTNHGWDTTIWCRGRIVSSAYSHAALHDATGYALSRLNPAPNLAAILGISAAA